MERDPAPLRWLVLILGPSGLAAVAAGLYDLIGDRARVGPLTSVLIIAVGGLGVWCALAFARRRQFWWHYAVAIAFTAALDPLDDWVLARPMSLQPSLWDGLLVAAAVYAAARAIRRRPRSAEPSDEVSAPV